jgi:hypothetical protein
MAEYKIQLADELMREGVALRVQITEDQAGMNSIDGTLLGLFDEGPDRESDQCAISETLSAGCRGRLARALPSTKDVTVCPMYVQDSPLTGI